MAFITSATRSDIVELAMGMLNQAPSTTLLNTLISKTTDGASLQDLADYIATTDAFTAQYPATQTAREFATEMFGKLITGGTLAAGVNTLVIDTLEGLLNSGTTKAQGFVAVIDFLSNPANASHPDLGDISKSFQNRADAAEYYSITKELGGSSDAQLAAAIASVTSDAATLTAANAAADTATGVVVVSSSELTTKTTDIINGTAGNDEVSGLVSVVSSLTTMNSGDLIVDSSATDSDTLTITTQADLTASNTASVRGFETVKVNAFATTLGDTNLDVGVANFSGVTTFEFDVTKPVSAVSGLIVDGLANGDIVKASDDFSSLDLEVATAGSGLVVRPSAVGTAGSPTSVTINAGTVAGDIDVVAPGYLSLTATTSTGALQATAAKNLTASSATSTVQILEATDGNLTVSDASATAVGVYTASGNISVSDIAATANKITATAGGTITLANGATGSVATANATLSAIGISSFAAMNSLTTLTVSGNDAPAFFPLNAGSNELSDVTVTGDQSVNLLLSAASVGVTSEVLNVYDATTAGTVTVELQSAAGDVDLRGGDLIDRLELDVNNQDKTLSVKSGQTITFTADQTSTAPGTNDNTIEVDAAASALTNSVTLVLDDEARDNNNVGLDGVTVTQARNVTIDGSVDKTATGAAVTHTIDYFEALTPTQVLNINMGSNNLIVDGVSTVGATGTINITGSGTVTDGTTTLTADTLDASAATGNVTLDTTTLNVNTIKTGAGTDAIKLSNANGVVVDTGAGSDTLTLHSGASLSGQVVSIDMGAGTADTLVLGNDTQLVTGSAGSITLAGIESIVFTTGADTADIQASLLNGATYNVAASLPSATQTVDVIVAATDTTVDLSKLVESTATASEVAGMTFITDASANTAAVAITGLDGAKNKISASAAAGDVITGGDKSDEVIVASAAEFVGATGTVLDTLDGGSGLNAAGTAQNTDTLTIGDSSNVAVTLGTTVGWASVKNFEALKVNSGTATATVTLPAAAETAGIASVTSAGTGIAVVSAATYTGKVTLNAAASGTDGNKLTGGAGGDTLTGATANTNTLTGGAGNDTLVGGTVVDTMAGGDGNDSLKPGTGADVLTGGAGDDSVLYLLEADLFNSSNDIADASVDGGDGTDTLLLGTSATPFTIANNDLWTGVTNVEKLSANSNTAAVSISLDVTAWAAGIRTVDISAGKMTSGNVIDVSEITSSYVASTATGFTLTGSSTELTNITGSNGIDTITGGDADDVIDGKGGNDIITITLGGSDTIRLGNGGADTVLGFTSGASTTTVNYDKLALLDVADANGNDLAGADLVDAAAISANDVAVDGNEVTEFNLIFSGTGLTSSTDGTGLIAALTAANGGTAVTLVPTSDGSSAAADAFGYFIAYQVGNAYVYYYDADSVTSDTAISAAEITLIGVLEGVAAGSMVADNI